MPDEVIDALVARSETSLAGSYDEMLQADDAFHASLPEHCDNRQMKDILLQLHDQNKIQITVHGRACAGLVSAERIQEARCFLRAHIEILDAMKRRKPQCVNDTTQSVYNVDPARAFVGEALKNSMYFVDPGRGPVPAHCGFSVLHSDEDLNIALDRMDHIFAKIK